MIIHYCPITSLYSSSRPLMHSDNSFPFESGPPITHAFRQFFPLGQAPSVYMHFRQFPSLKSGFPITHVIPTIPSPWVRFSYHSCIPYNSFSLGPVSSPPFMHSTHIPFHTLPICSQQIFRLHRSHEKRANVGQRPHRYFRG